jgi:tetratricopeptide (TPR) repeat protein
MEKFLANAKPEKLIASDYVYYSKLLAKTPGKDSLSSFYMEKALDLDSNDYQLYTDLSNMYTTAGKYKDAVRVNERLINNKTTPSINDYYYLGRAYFNNKQYDKADSAFAKVVEMKPESYTGYLWRGKSSFYLDPNNEKGLAKPYMEKYVEIVSADSANYKKFTRDLITAYEYLGFYYFVKNDMNKAEENYKALLAIDPANAKALDFFKRRKK